MRRVLLTGNQAVKTIDWYEHACMEAEVLPSLVMQDGKDSWGHDMIEMGIILSCTPLRLLDPGQEGDDDTYEPFEVAGLTAAFTDPILWWRTLQLLEALPVIEERHFYFDLYVAAGRRDAEDHDSDYEQQIIQEIRALLGGAGYEAIMSRPVPMNVLQLLITLVDEGHDLHLAVAMVSDEIAAGTIRWSQELKRIGVQHPDYLHAVKAAKQQLIRRYEAFLCSYATFKDCPYDPGDWKQKGGQLLSVEWRLYDCIERDIERQYGQGITIMLGALLAQIDIDDIYEHLEQEYPIEGRRPFHRPSFEKRCEEIVRWFVQNFPADAETDAARTALHSEYLETLQRLYRQWDQLPVVTPLVS